MFEDINFGADGGMYAELIKNRSVEFPDGLLGWNKLGAPGSARVLERENQSTNNRHYLQLTRAGITNGGFRGIGLRQGAEYLFSLQARNTGGAPVSLRVELVNASGQALGQAKLRGVTGDWRTYRATLRAAATEARAQLKLVPENSGVLDLDLVSLFPKATWKGRAGGLRADLVQLLGELKPGFLRFPGGCIVEGRNLEVRFNSAELAPLDDLQHYIRDALDLIEFANGAATTPWGRKRAALGHPAPFNLKLLGVGNEQWGPQYVERYELFAKAIKAKYPQLTLITSAGPSPNDDRFHYPGKAFVLAHADLKAENSLNEPQKIAPVEQAVTIPAGAFTLTLAPQSLTVLRIPVK